MKLFLGIRQRLLPPKRRAFTLIELLVVISVIALLMAVLLPALRGVRHQARKVVCRSNLRQFGQVLAVYVENNDGRLPLGTANALWILRGSLPGEQSDPNVPDVVQRTRIQKAACCPMASKPSENGRQTVGIHQRSNGSTVVDIAGTMGSRFRAWTITSPEPEFHASYGFNLWLFGGYIGNLQSSDPGLNVFTMVNRTRMPVLLDSPSPGNTTNMEHEASPPKGQNGGLMMPFCINRHNGRVNGLFLDWSVREIGVKELWTLKWTPNFNTTGPWTLAGGVQPEDWPEWMRGFKDY